MALLMTAYNTRLKTYILIGDNDEFSQKLFFTICRRIPSSILNDIKIIETFSEFTDVDANIYVCRCLDNSDYDKFKGIIKNNVNSCVVDFYSLEEVSLDININNPTFSNIVLGILLKKLNEDEEIRNCLDDIADKYRYLSKENLQTYLDAITFLTFYKNISKALNELGIKREDRNTLKKYFVSMEGDKNGK